MAPRIGILGGTGLYEWPGAETVHVETPYGDVDVSTAVVGGRRVFFVPRHGAGHAVAAHRVNYRANVWALRAAHCDYAVGVNNSGSLRAEIRPGTLLAPDDFIDRTRGRADTFHDEETVHVQLDPPYCPTVRAALRLPGAVYATVDGPRFETPAEARALAAAGADVVGMTGYPEVALAREAGLHYASLVYVANHAAGMGRTPSARTIQRRMADDSKRVLQVLRRAIAALPEHPGCGCVRGLAQARLSGAAEAKV